MRSLASIRVVSDVQAIPGADKIEVAIVDGWKVVVGKGDFKPGDKAVYCEIDSFLPVEPDFEFLRKSSYKQLSDGREGFRLKTIKLRKQVSQGLLLPLTSLEIRGHLTAKEFPVGLDVTSALGVSLYEPPVPAQLAGEIRAPFPKDLVPRTDEERVQNLSLADLAKPRFYWVTEKLDGTSFTAFEFKDRFGVCSRNIELKDDDKNLYWRIAWQYNLPEKMKGTSLAIQGEICGPGVQGNPYKLPAPALFVFSMYDIAKQRYLRYGDMRVICDAFKLPRVPLLSAPNLYPLEDPYPTPVSFESHDDLLRMADGNSVFGDMPREGLVFKCYEPEFFSFKIISNDYLMGEKDEKEETVEVVEPAVAEKNQAPIEASEAVNEILMKQLLVDELAAAVKLEIVR